MENTNTSTATPTVLSQPSFGISDTAAAQIAFLLSDEPPGTVFRISVAGGGCSGFSYVFDLDVKGAGDTDFVVGNVAIDDVSIGMLSGSQIDYAEDLSGAGFSIKNPNATVKCGCGNSFGV